MALTVISYEEYPREEKGSSLLPFIKDRVLLGLEFQIRCHNSHILFKTNKITLYPYDIDIFLTYLFLYMGGLTQSQSQLTPLWCEIEASRWGRVQMIFVCNFYSFHLAM